MAVQQISRTTIVALLVATTAALVARSWLQIKLLQDGMPQPVAADISYLVVPAVLILLLFPLWRNEKSFLKDQFRAEDLTVQLALQALAVGLLIRILWWCQLVADVSFGITSSAEADAIVGPVFVFQCASPGVVFLGFLVMTVLVPIIEEITHRGYIQTALHHRGGFIAVLISALAFAVFHKLTSWPFAFFAGIVFGVQYWATRSLWSSLISHATINGLIQLDWRCLNGQWNPQSADLPLLLPGITAVLTFVVCLTVLVRLLLVMLTGAASTPR